MPNCNHAHGPSNVSPDLLTTFNKYAEYFLSLGSNTYWFADLFDLASGMEGEYGASFYGYGFGLFMALLTAPGASYCHAIMNIQHQNPADDHQHEHNHQHEHEHEHNHQHGHGHHHEALPIEQTNSETFTTGYVALTETKEEKHSHGEPSYLLFKDKVMLVGDAITHVGDAAATVTAIVNDVTKNKLPRWGKGVLQCGSTLFSAFYIAADLRSCKNAIIDHNKAQKNHEDENLRVARMA
jgi:hypothetical protein